MTGGSCRMGYAIGLATVVGLASWVTGAPGPRVSSQRHNDSGAVTMVSQDRFQSKAPRFEQNQGQTDPQVHFLARGRRHALFLTSDAAVLSLRRGDSRTRDVVRMKPAGSGALPAPEGLERTAGATHYLRGTDPASWRANVPTYAKVRYPNVYPGIDLVYYGREGQIEYDFIVSPGADPGVIRVQFEAAGSVRLDDQGDLLIETAGGALRQSKPFVYQDLPRGRTEVPGDYMLLAGNEVGFQLARYDARWPLVIDPVLTYSTYLGEDNDDIGNDVWVDPEGNAYVTGLTESSDFPVTDGVFQPEFEGGDEDVFVTKFNASGSEVIFSTFLGGDNGEVGNGIAVDDSGNVYVTGGTSSSDFPITEGAIQSQYGGGDQDCFVTKLAPDGGTAVFSTFLGAGSFDQCTAIAVDAMGNTYVTGVTSSSQFPVAPGAFQTNFGGDEDAFVTKYDAAGDVVLYSTFLGAGNKDGANAIAVDSEGRAYVTGYTQSDQFPVTGDARQPARDGERDAFMAKLSSNGRALLYGTFHGGSDNDEGRAIALDAEGTIYIAGITESTDLPISLLPFQRNFGGGDSDAFVAKFDPSGALGIYSTYLGGEGGDSANAMAVDFFGNAAIVGATRSVLSFPVSPSALQPNFGGGSVDAFVAKLDARGERLLEATYLGGDGDDEAKGVAIDSPGNIYVTGFTRSGNFPITEGAFQDSRSNSEVFLSRIGIGRFTSVPAASFAETAAAPASIVSGFGEGLATMTAEAPAGQPLPPELAGVRVTLTDSQGFVFTAPLFVVSPTQINYLVPAGVALGPAVAVVTRNGAEVASGVLEIAAVSPGVFSANADGLGVAAAFVTRRNAAGDSMEFIFSNAPIGSRIAVPINLGAPTDQVFLSLFGTGIRGGGEIALSIGGTPVDVLFAGDQMQFQGLDQVNALLPRSLIGRGLVGISLTVDGEAANVVTISIQ